MNEITLPTLNKVSLKKPISIAFSICVLFHILLYLCFQIFEPLEIVGEIIILALKLLVFYIAGVCANDTFIKTHQMIHLLKRIKKPLSRKRVNALPSTQLFYA